MDILTNFDFDEFKKQALEELKNGKPLSGKDGVMTPLIKGFLEAALEAELDHHLEGSEANRRNGKSSKKVKSEFGSFELETPRDRKSDFQPQIVKKRQTVIGSQIEEKVLSLYALGMSYKDINSHLEDMYGVSVSNEQINTVTEKVMPLLNEWQSRQLDSVYPFVWLDAMHFKVREDGKAVTRALYNVIALNVEGKKELLGIYLSESEGANFWLNVLTDLHNRGVDDILIASIDNLKGFAQAISSIFPRTEVQLCLVHQVRNSLRYVTSNDHKPFLKDLKRVYRASTKELAEQELDRLEDIWGEKYQLVIRSWRSNWDRLSPFFSYSKDIRRIMYTTNPIESFHRQIRKVTKNKGVFASEKSLKKLIFMAIQKITADWKQPRQNWALTLSQLAIKFEERLTDFLS